MQDTVAARAPASFWIIAALSLLWNLFGAYDYTMTNLRDPGYLAQFPPEMIDYVDEMPIWALGVWTLGVWAAVIGSVLLLLRSRHAVYAFAASFAGLALSTVYQLTSDMPAAMKSAGNYAMTAVIWVAVIFFWYYATRMRRAGVIR